MSVKILSLIETIEINPEKFFKHTLNDRFTVYPEIGNGSSFIIVDIIEEKVVLITTDDNGAFGIPSWDDSGININNLNQEHAPRVLKTIGFRFSEFKNYAIAYSEDEIGYERAYIVLQKNEEVILVCTDRCAVQQYYLDYDELRKK